ncbi:MAG: CoA-binding protein, partial [Desulfobacterales bacterium]|nr:CoA-binding protein [Desulfobacterales bacterium]
MTDPVSSFFNPRGVALIGTSTSPNKLSFGIIRNLVEGNYTGRIFPINPRHQEVLGVLVGLNFLRENEVFKKKH